MHIKTDSCSEFREETLLCQLISFPNKWTYLEQEQLLNVAEAPHEYLRGTTEAEILEQQRFYVFLSFHWKRGSVLVVADT
jgi:hypothetical protein